MSENESEQAAGSALVRSITWKQGLFIALGVPILILPSLYDVADTIWAFSIVMWTVCVLQGFLQNTAYGEMVTVFPRAAGLPGCAQVVFEPVDKSKKYNTGKMIGAFCAWCYWFAWTPVVSIFTLMIGDYINYFVFDNSFDNLLLLYVVLGLIIVVAMTLISSRGLTGGSAFGLVLAIVAIVPLVVILVAAYFAGGAGGGAMFSFDLIKSEFLPVGWDWGSVNIVLLFGVFALAQWSGCAWETAALYGPEYKNPNKDVPKALFACGIICLILYFFVSTTIFGSLGMSGIDDGQYHTVGLIAKAVFGNIGGAIALTLLVAAMVLIIQTGFLGSSRTLYYMSHEGNMPKFLGKQNKHGMPVNAMLAVSIFNMILVVTATVQIGDFTGGPMMILAASAVAYCLAHVVALSAYVKSKINARFKDLPRPFSAPRGWKYVAIAMVIYEAFVLIPCLFYWMNLNGDGNFAIQLTTIVGLIILLMFFPIWYYTQNTNPGDDRTEAESD